MTVVPETATAPHAPRAPHADRHGHALAALRAVETRTGLTPDVVPDTALFSVAPGVAGLLPGGALVAGSTVVVAGSTTLLLALLAAPSRAGAWTVFVGHPEVGLAAAADAGCELSRTLCVPDPGPDAPAVVAALLDGMDLVVVGPRTALHDADRRRLTARARERGAVLIAAQERGAQGYDVREQGAQGYGVQERGAQGYDVRERGPQERGTQGYAPQERGTTPRTTTPWTTTPGRGTTPGRATTPPDAAWPGAQVTLTAGPGTWTGSDHGAGHLHHRTLDVRRTGRGTAARPSTFRCVLGCAPADRPVEQPANRQAVRPAGGTTDRPAGRAADHPVAGRPVARAAGSPAGPATRAEAG
ncbi:hypothetical protein [Myceligenerans crystallogenes]|uniref:Uncharacterized protein n=1 Tax=Myceligenerans crystallogenes TaxID=316335 RepID=A0ABN2NH01_9MICO